MRPRGVVQLVDGDRAGRAVDGGDRGAGARGAGQRGAQHEPAAGALGDPGRGGHAAPSGGVVTGGAGRADLHDDPAGRFGAAGHLDPRPGVDRRDVVDDLRDDVQQLDRGAGLDGGVGSAAHVDPHRLVGRVDGLVEQRGQPGGGAGSGSGVDAREQQQRLRVVPHPTGRVDQFGQPGRLGCERVGAHPVHQAHVAVDPLPQPPQHVGGHLAIARAVAQATPGRARATATVLASGRALAPDVRRVTLGREHVVAHHRSSRVGFGSACPRRWGGAWSGRDRRSLAARYPDRPGNHHLTGAQHAGGCDGRPVGRGVDWPVRRRGPPTGRWLTPGESGHPMDVRT